MTKKFKAWLTPEEFGPDSRLCVAFEMPIGSGQFTVKTIPAKMVSEISMYSSTADNSVVHELRMTAAQEGDPYLPISGEHVVLGVFRTQKEASKALGVVQKAVGYGRLHTRRIEGIGFLAGGFILASVLFGLMSVDSAPNDKSLPPELAGSSMPYIPEAAGPSQGDEAESDPNDAGGQDEYYGDIKPGNIALVKDAILANKGGMFQVGEGSPLAIVLSDPMCPSCKQTKALFEEAKLPYLVAPVGKLSPESVTSAIKILCANDKATFYAKSFEDRSIDIDTRNPKEIESCGEALLRNNELFDRTLSRGVPTFIRLSDSEIRPEGFNSAADLKAWLTKN